MVGDAFKEVFAEQRERTMKGKKLASPAVVSMRLLH